MLSFLLTHLPYVVVCSFNASTTIILKWEQEVFHVRMHQLCIEGGRIGLLVTTDIPMTGMYANSFPCSIHTEFCAFTENLSQTSIQSSVSSYTQCSSNACISSISYRQNGRGIGSIFYIQGVHITVQIHNVQCVLVSHY